MVFDGRELSGLPPHRIACLGVARTFQNLRLFSGLSVLDNVLCGLTARAGNSYLEAFIRTPGLRHRERRLWLTALETLDIFGLADRASVPADALSYGEKKRLDLARAFVSSPKLVLLDEPVAGLNSDETERVGTLIRQMRRGGATLILVEHDMDLVMSVSDHVVVLDGGRRIAAGRPKTSGATPCPGSVSRKDQRDGMTTMESRKTLLHVQGLTLHYGAAQALFGIDLDVAEGETVAIVGANGAGKSSLLKAITGIVAPSGGHILFAGQDVTGQPPSRMATLGVALSPEGREMFGDLSVRENLVLGAVAGQPSKAELGRRIEEVFGRFPKLRERSAQRTATLSGGEQQMVAIGRALMARPRLLLLDEPSLGLAPLVTDEIFDIIHRLARGGRPSSWWSRTQRAPSAPPPRPICWPTVGSSTRERATNCSCTRSCVAPFWGRPRGAARPKAVWGPLDSPTSDWRSRT